MSSRAFNAALVCVLIGLGASVAAAYVHYQLALVPGYESFCDVSATVSCKEAYQSEYGRFLGMPVSVLGAGYFGGLLGLLMLGRRLEALASYVLVIALAGLLFVLYLAWATVFVLGTLCPLCLATYAAVAGLFFISGAVSAVPLIDVPARISHDLRRLVTSPVALAVCAIVIGATAVSGALFPADSVSATADPATRAAAAAAQVNAEPPLTDAQKAEVRVSYDRQPRVIVPADAPGASVVVVKFNDYQCPPCRETFELYKPIKAKWDEQAPGKVKFITRDFPLENECNASVSGTTHAAACEAAAAVRMARETGKADGLEDWIFANQASLTPELVRQGAREVGGVTDFDGRYTQMLGAVKSDTALGASLGVKSTPTFFINGVRLAGGVPPRVLDYIIEYELGKTASAAQ